MSQFLCETESKERGNKFYSSEYEYAIFPGPLTEDTVLLPRYVFAGSVKDDLKGLMLDKISQTQTDKYGTFSLVCGS